jgi:hypothetical protein
MNSILSKAGAVLAVIIGLMAIFAGGKVLIGILPDYNVINWLPGYNFSAGLISATAAAFLIWKQSRYGLAAAAAVLGAHISVMLVLLIAYAEVVAVDSLMAMTIRISVWTVILALLLIQRRRNSVQVEQAKAVPAQK